METKAKGIPYGIGNFEQVRRGNFYYADKTMYLPFLEEIGNYLFLIRPRRFGKSLFVSMMRAYYDLSMSGRFDELFGGLWIHEHPTELKNAFQVIYLDFSRIGGSSEEDLKESFNGYCCAQLDEFIKSYRTYYDEDTCEKILSSTKGKLSAANAVGRKQHGIPIKKYIFKKHFLVLRKTENLAPAPFMKQTKAGCPALRGKLCNIAPAVQNDIREIKLSHRLCPPLSVRSGCPTPLLSQNTHFRA